ncbi:MAG: site-specific DNA-methyltransferase [Zavarzinella sp.]
MKPIAAGDPESQSADIVAENIAQLRGLFPEAFTEGKIDFDVLKQLLGRSVDEREEKYGLNWHGKRRARQLALTPSTGTLRPALGEGVDEETTQNLVIEGDNLEVLKLLQKSYSGKVKLIYIDPPYNTGKDFVYPDNFHDNIKNYLELTGQIEGGTKIASNTETSGRFHTHWLNMMYPRLMLARNLLREDGVIFVSCDDTELLNLNWLLHEVFGEENFIHCLVWQKKVSPSNDSRYFSNDHDYILTAARQLTPLALSRLARTEDHNKYYSNPDEDPKGLWNSTAATCNKSSEERPNLYYPIINPKTKQEVWPRKEAVWALSRSRMEELNNNGELYWGLNGESSSPRIKNYLSEASDVVPRSVLLYKDVGHTQSATSELRHLFEDSVFNYPKPTTLLQHLVQIGGTTHESKKNDLILDFFAGSGTTGHAVMAQNAADGGNRRFILVQLPEPLDPENKDQKTAANFCDNLGKPRTIAELTKERLRRAGKKVKDEHPMFAGDTGFRVFKLDSSNIRTWDPNPDDLDATMFDSVEHLKEGRTSDDILTELLLKLGLDLCVPIESKMIAKKKVYSIGGGVLFACLEETIATETVEALALGIADWHQTLAPIGESQAVFRDSAFEDDIAKTNLTAILSQHGLKNVRSL